MQLRINRAYRAVQYFDKRLLFISHEQFEILQIDPKYPDKVKTVYSSNVKISHIKTAKQFLIVVTEHTTSVLSTMFCKICELKCNIPPSACFVSELKDGDHAIGLFSGPKGAIYIVSAESMKKVQEEFQKLFEKVKELQEKRFGAEKRLERKPDDKFSQESAERAKTELIQMQSQMKKLEENAQAPVIKPLCTVVLSDAPDHLEISYDKETRKVSLTLVQSTSLQTQISTIQHVLQLEGDEKDNCINQKLLRLI